MRNISLAITLQLASWWALTHVVPGGSASFVLYDYRDMLAIYDTAYL